MILGLSQSAAMEQSLLAHDQLHEHNRFDVELASEEPPFNVGAIER